MRLVSFFVNIYTFNSDYCNKNNLKIEEFVYICIKYWEIFKLEKMKL